VDLKLLKEHNSSFNMKRRSQSVFSSNRPIDSVSKRQSKDDGVVDLAKFGEMNTKKKLRGLSP
jgi:hypothetical protein